MQYSSRRSGRFCSILVATFCASKQIPTRNPILPTINMPVALVVDGSAPDAPVIITPPEGVMITHDLNAALC